MLTKYDEYPIHQAVAPFSEIPSTDYAWNDGYYFDVYDAAAGIDLFMSMRIHPNSNVVGAFAGIVAKGRQRTVRLSRPWRPECDTVIGPFRIDFPEPFRRIRLTLDENVSGLGFDVEWQGSAPPVEEQRRSYTVNGRRVTDQLRYLQAGEAVGSITLDGRRFDVRGPDWCAFRDHSWGLYFETPPFKPAPQWLAPPARTRSFEPHAHLTPARLAFYTWNWFRIGNCCGVYWIYEDENGKRAPVFDSPQAMDVGGVIDYGWDGPRVHIVDVQHELRFHEGTRQLRGGIVRVTDERGGVWTHELDVGSSPWIFWPGGVWPGSWKDGGTWATYRGEGPAIEWDEVDVSRQPLDYHSAANLPAIRKIAGSEYVTKVRVTDPTGKVHDGVGHCEHMTVGRYLPYGFEDESYRVTGEGVF